MTTKEIIDTLNKKFGIVKDEAWFTSLSKTAHSKNITIAEWNAIIYQVAAAVGSVDALREALTDIVEYDELTLKNVLAHIAANSTQISTNASNIAATKISLTQVTNDVNTGFDETRRTFDELRTDFDKDFETVSRTLEGYEKFTEARFEQVEDTVDGKLKNLTKAVSDTVSKLDENTASIKELPRTIEFSMGTDFKLTVILKNEAGTQVDTATVDLPIESSVTDMSFDDDADEIVFTLRNGASTRVPITGVLRGIVTDLESTEDNKVLAASVGPIIIRKINEAVADKITATQLSDTLTEALKDYAKTDDVRDNITQTQLDTQLSNTLKDYVKNDAIKDFTTDTDVDTKIENALDNYRPQCEVTGTEFAKLEERVAKAEKNKVDKHTTPNTVYAIDSTGESQDIPYGDGANAIAQRTATGGLSIPDNAIVNPTDAVNRDYVDNKALVGKDGKSAYQLALDEGFEGSLSEWLASLVGTQGPKGNDGKDGKPFTIAKIYPSIDEMNADYSNPDVEQGSFVTIDTGNIADEDNAKLFIKGATGFVYLTDLSGAAGMQGPEGKSAYEVAKANGFEGTVTQWLASLHGKDGSPGAPGANGDTPYIQNGYWYIDGVNLNVRAQGENGANGERGVGILKVTSAPSSYTTAIGGKNPIKRMSISTIKTQSGVSSVLVGDQISHSYYLYHIYHLDDAYAYMDEYTSIRGGTGANGISPHIGENGNWWIGDTDTLVPAEGADGTNGVGIETIKRTSTSETVDVYTITLTNGNTHTFEVPHGKDGTNGKTPVYGIDFFTPEDKANIVTAVLEAIGTPLFGLVDENNNVVLSGKLADGSYSIKYEMENGSTVNIGNLVLDTAVYYSVTKTLTHCTISNSATKVVEGSSYYATITADSGYTLKTVTVTMGGANVSVSNGVINIASVTGNIVITAVAEVAGPAYTNQIPISTDTDNSVFNGTGYMEKRRLSSSYNVSTLTNASASNPAFVTGFIPAKAGDIIRLENCYVDSNYVKDTAIYGADTASFNIGIFNSSKTKVGSQANQWPRMSAAGSGDYDTSVYFDSFVTDSNGYTTQFKVKTDLGIDISYIRLCLAVEAGFTVADAIVTVNQEID